MSAFLSALGRLRRPQRRLAIFVAVLLGFLGALPAPVEARARRRVAVFREGRKGGGALAAITIAVERRHQVISEAQVKQLRKKARVRGNDARALKRLAKVLDADGLVVVGMAGRGRRSLLDVRVLDNQARLVERVRVPLLRADTDAESEQRATLDVMAALTRLPGDAVPAEEAAPEPPPPPEAPPSPRAVPPTPQATEEPAPIEGQPRRATAPREEEAAAVAPADDEGRPPGADVGIGLGFVRRSFEFTPVGGAKLQAYQGNPVAGVLAIAHVYPLALAGKRGLLAGLGLYLRFDRTFALTSQLQGSDQTFSSSIQLGSLGLEWRVDLGSSARPPSLALRLGLGSRRFQLDDPSGLVKIPSVEYGFVELGVVGRLPIGSTLGLFAGLSYLSPFATGPVGEAKENGVGAAGAASGLLAEGGVELRVMRWLSLQAALRWEQYSHTFTAAAGQTATASAATDDYLGGHLLGAVVF